MLGSNGTTLQHHGPSYVALQSGGLEQVASFSWSQGLFLFSHLTVCRNCLQDRLKSKSGIHLPRSRETWASIPSTMKK